MKKLFFFLSILLSLSSFAQSEKYVSAMQPRVAAIDSTRNPAALAELSSAFERIGDAEKNQWLPYYYAALAKVNSGTFMANGKTGGMTAQLDPIADKAEELLNKAAALSKDNSEIYVVRYMIATLRIISDPMSRYMTYGPEAEEALKTARQLDPGNPRIYLLEGQDKFFKPAMVGGNKEEAVTIWKEALQKYDSFKPANALAPNWGRRTTEYFLTLSGK